MKRRTSSGVNLFFLEFIIALFFFLLTGAVCIRIFFHSFQVTRDAEALSHAQALAAGVAEALEGTDGSGAALLSLYPDGQFSDGTLTLSFDRDFISCDEADASYVLTARLSASGRRKEAYLTVTDRVENVIYELNVFFYRPAVRSEVLS